MGDDLAARVAAERATLEAGLAQLRAEAARWGIALDANDCAQAEFALQRDPCSGELSLLARWHGDRRRASLAIREDGFLYGEWDVLAPHPSQRGQWIEMVVTWGKPPCLKSEPRLIAMPA
mgnify:FL=1